ETRSQKRASSNTRLQQQTVRARLQTCRKSFPFERLQRLTWKGRQGLPLTALYLRLPKGAYI
ncbi:MAG: hypothetical protein DMG24_00695, partial [Acidobacteria bacterium]